MKKKVNDLWERFWQLISSVSVRVKMLGLALGLVLLLGAGVVWQVQLSLSKTFQEQLREQSVNLTRDLAARAADPILLNDLVGLQRLLDETISNNPDVHYAFVLNKDGEVLAHTFGAGFPVDLLEVNTVQSQEHHHTAILDVEEDLVVDTAVPIFDGRAGIARLGVSNLRLRRSLQIILFQIALVIAVVLAIGVVIASILTWILTRPVIELVQATNAVAQGDFSSQLQRWADDEFGDLADAFNSMTLGLAHLEELRREREELRRQLLERVISTQEEERKRIARELHDSTSQNLTSLMVGIKSLSAQCDKPEIEAKAENLRMVASETLDEIHSISMRLRPRVLDDIGLSAALEKLTDEWQARYKIPLDLMLQCSVERMPAEIETAVYRIVQEALTNIARHAEATVVSILVEQRQDCLLTVIEDNGQGFDATEKMGDNHLGLVGMRERAELLNGKLTIESSSKSGTSIYVDIPLKERVS